MKRFHEFERRAISVMELFAIVTILAVLAAIIVPRVTVSTDAARRKLDRYNRATINAAVERWYLEKGEWPVDDLSDIGADSDYFPVGIPINPVSGEHYSLDTSTYRVR